MGAWGDDYRAKVSDFGLVKVAPGGGQFSIETRLAGTFGYLAPEYAGKVGFSCLVQYPPISRSKLPRIPDLDTQYFSITSEGYATNVFLIDLPLYTCVRISGSFTSYLTSQKFFLSPLKCAHACVAFRLFM